MAGMGKSTNKNKHNYCPGCGRRGHRQMDCPQNHQNFNHANVVDRNTVNVTSDNNGSSNANANMNNKNHHNSSNDHENRCHHDTNNGNDNSSIPLMASSSSSYSSISPPSSSSISLSSHHGSTSMMKQQQKLESEAAIPNRTDYQSQNSQNITDEQHKFSKLLQLERLHHSDRQQIKNDTDNDDDGDHHRHQFHDDGTMMMMMEEMIRSIIRDEFAQSIIPTVRHVIQEEMKNAMTTITTTTMLHNNNNNSSCFPLCCCQDGARHRHRSKLFSSQHRCCCRHDDDHSYSVDQTNIRSNGTVSPWRTTTATGRQVRGDGYDNPSHIVPQAHHDNSIQSDGQRNDNGCSDSHLSTEVLKASVCLNTMVPDVVPKPTAAITTSAVIHDADEGTYHQQQRQQQHHDDGDDKNDAGMDSNKNKANDNDGKCRNDDPLCVVGNFGGVTLPATHEDTWDTKLDDGDDWECADEEEEAHGTCDNHTFSKAHHIDSTIIAPPHECDDNREDADDEAEWEDDRNGHNDIFLSSKTASQRTTVGIESKSICQHRDGHEQMQADSVQSSNMKGHLQSSPKQMPVSQCEDPWGSDDDPGTSDVTTQPTNEYHSNDVSSKHRYVTLPHDVNSVSWDDEDDIADAEKATLQQNHTVSDSTQQQKQTQGPQRPLAPSSILTPPPPIQQIIHQPPIKERKMKTFVITMRKRRQRKRKSMICDSIDPAASLLPNKQRKHNRLIFTAESPDELFSVYKSYTRHFKNGITKVVPSIIYDRLKKNYGDSCDIFKALANYISKHSIPVPLAVFNDLKLAILLRKRASAMFQYHRHHNHNSSSNIRHKKEKDDHSIWNDDNNDDDNNGAWEQSNINHLHFIEVLEYCWSKLIPLARIDDLSFTSNR